mgnify:CR=1 FL=1
MAVSEPRLIRVEEREAVDGLVPVGGAEHEVRLRPHVCGDKAHARRSRVATSFSNTAGEKSPAIST